MREQHVCECLHCGHQWRSALDRPSVCPQCKSYSWDQPLRKPGKKKEKKMTTTTVYRKSHDWGDSIYNTDT